MAYHNNAYGVWVVYETLEHVEAISIHENSVLAIESHRRNYGSAIAFWPLSLTFKDAIKAWETREEETDAATPSSEGISRETP